MSQNRPKRVHSEMALFLEKKCPFCNSCTLSFTKRHYSSEMALFSEKSAFFAIMGSTFLTHFGRNGFISREKVTFLPFLTNVFDPFWSKWQLLSRKSALIVILGQFFCPILVKVALIIEKMCPFCNS